MRCSAGQVVARANSVIDHRMHTLAIFVVIASHACVRTGLIVITAIRAILTLLCLTNAPRHQCLKFRPQFRNMIVPSLDGIGRKCRVRKVYAPGRILNAITCLTPAAFDVRQRGAQFSNMIISDLDDISRKRDIGKRHGGQPPARELKVDLRTQLLNMVVPRLDRIGRKRRIRPRRWIC